MASVAASPAMAQAMPDRGWYVGGSFGKTEDNESCPTTSCDLKDVGIRAEWERLNKSDVDMMSIGIQYRF